MSKDLNDDAFPSLSFPPSKKTFIKLVLPTELIKSIVRINLTQEGKRKSLLFIDMLITYSLQKNNSPTEYVHFSSAHFRRKFNSRYREWLSHLLENKIVISDNSYDTRTGKSLHYRINPNLVKDWNDLTSGVVWGKNKDFYTTVDEIYYDGLKRFYNSLKIDFELLEVITEQELSNIDDEQSRNYKLFAWKRVIERLKYKGFYAHRNETNNRLDTNFTGFPKALLKVIMAANNLIEIDAVNSQFAIIANIIRDKVNDSFIDDAINGLLYEKVAEKLGCERETAKIKMMKTIYSKSVVKNKDKTLIKELYPETIEYLDKYKTEKSNRELAISMQKKESELYIDGILNRLYKLGILAISKHDSIIFHQKDKAQVQEVVREVFSGSGFELKIKIN